MKLGRRKKNRGYFEDDGKASRLIDLFSIAIWLVMISIGGIIGYFVAGPLGIPAGIAIAWFVFLVF